MVKFFLKNTKGYVKTYFPPEKKKPSKTSCSQSLQKKIVIVLKKQLTHCIQKTIRQIHEEKQEEKNKAFVQQLNLYKTIKKHEIKMLSYFILLEEIKVDQHSFRSIFKLEPSEVTDAIGENIRTFYDVVKTKPTYLTEITQSQTIKNIVGEKKKIKKEKAKLRKKVKLESGAKKPEKMEVEEQKIEDAQSKSISEQKVEIPSKVREQKPAKTIPITAKQLKKQKTQFKKTGRNKFLQQKLNKKKRRVFEERKTQDKPAEQPQNPKLREQTPHPSWQAKRDIKNQMFIQPFEGKKILFT